MSRGGRSNGICIGCREPFRGQPTINQVLAQFVGFLGDPDSILVAHNARFDLNFLAIAMARLGLVCPPHHIFDTLALARALLPGLPTYSLADMGRTLGVAKGAPHRALGDALLVKDVFLTLLRRSSQVIMV
ncbi:MAG: 3'-5' exonuclease [Nitrospinae bacterium]|nr:3'-5' exonuclease [Nitrospinota bacterium]